MALMFGALVSRPESIVAGRGIPLEKLSFAMLIFPAVWDWYVQWRERRRGFYTRWEVEMLHLAMALTREKTGWLRQQPHMADRLQPVEGLIAPADIEVAQSDWGAACDRAHAHAAARSKEIERVARIHRDPFEPILPILEAHSPVAEYRKIADEILKHAPNCDRYPRRAAESVRSFLLIRLGLHLGLRKNLRQLLVCPRDQLPRSERKLESLKRGEIRWNDREHGWEVFIPAVAFKKCRLLPLRGAREINFGWLFLSLDSRNAAFGRVAEWFKAAVLKTAVGSRPSWVRIPPRPPSPLCGPNHPVRP